MGTMSLGGQVAVVTGSTRGIGLATAHALANRGARVVINGTLSQEVSSVLGQFHDRGVLAAGCAGDVSAEVKAAGP